MKALRSDWENVGQDFRMAAMSNGTALNRGYASI